MSRVLLLALCLVLGCISSCKSTEPPPKKQIPRRGPHRPIFPPRDAPKKSTCTGKPTVIAVIDTGYGNSAFNHPDAHLCKFGHRDYTGGIMSFEFDTKDPVPLDNHGHGTHIAGIIDSFAKKGNLNYCIVVLKYYEARDSWKQNIDGTIKAIKYATSIHADFINYSGGGIVSSQEEKDAVKAYIDGGGTFVAAAGNDNSDLAKIPFYPAMDDDRVIVVGMGKDKDHVDHPSDYGDRVNMWEPGRNIKVYDMYMSGTSQSTAIATGKLVYKTHNFCK